MKLNFAQKVAVFGAVAAGFLAGASFICLLNGQVFLGAIETVGALIAAGLSGFLFYHGVNAYAVAAEVVEG